MIRFLASVLCLSSVALLAGAADELAVAKEALRDGLWEVARAHAAAAHPVAEARLVVLESFAGENKWEEIGKRLAEWKDAQGDGFDYYRALARGDHASAVAILKRGGTSEGLVEAKLFEAQSLAKAGRRDEADGIWREIASATNVGERAFAVSCANLMDAALLRRACTEVKTTSFRQLVGLRLGLVLLKDAKTFEEGGRIIRAIVKDSPDADGAREAFLAIADAEVDGERWKEAEETYRKAIEIWPDAVKLASVQQGRGRVFRNLGRKEDALDAFRRFGELAASDEQKAVALLSQGDVLAEMDKDAEAMECYKSVLARHPGTEVAKRLKQVVWVREMEGTGRNLYKEFKFAEAMSAFEEVTKADASRRWRMSFYEAMCLYGLGRDDEAGERIKRLIEECKYRDEDVRLDSMLWLAKFRFNRREWKEAGALFEAYAASRVPSESAANALLWAARAAFAENDCSRAIQLCTEIAGKYPDTKAKLPALLVQGEALIELARFDEAVLVLDRVVKSEALSEREQLRARTLKSDALYVMGADNAARYVAALEEYRAIRFGGALSASGQVVVSFKIARCLDKLKRVDEAIDQYYTKVVLAYREGCANGVRFDEESRTAFSRAALRLADEFESRGRDRQAVGVLRLVVESDVPASDEAEKRIGRIESKGRFL